MNPKLTYLALMVFTITFPLLRSFDHRFRYANQWKYLWQGGLATAVFFIAWDVYFTKIGVWSFNNDYVLGYYFLGLPVEEWSFFVCVPFSCVFIYECIGYYFKPDVGAKWSVPFMWVLIGLLTVVSVYNYDKWYTGVKLGTTALALLIHYWIFGKKYLGKFFVAYFFTLIPFLLVNGVLTYLPVVSYNNAENLGIRIKDLIPVPLFNIPIEDSMYSLLLLIMNVSGLEYFRQKNKTESMNSQLSNHKISPHYVPAIESKH